MLQKSTGKHNLFYCRSAFVPHSADDNNKIKILLAITNIQSRPGTGSLFFVKIYIWAHFEFLSVNHGDFEPYMSSNTIY